jgi:hypothetical protein
MTRGHVILLIVCGLVATLAISLSSTEPISQTKPSVCPNCGQEGSIVPIIYGKPGQDLINDAKNRKCVLGGCVIKGNSPKWQCLNCGESWGIADEAREHF